MSKYSTRVNKIYEYMKVTRGKGRTPLHCNKQTIALVIECCKTGDFKAAHNTKLYTHNSGCYCALQSAIVEIKE